MPDLPLIAVAVATFNRPDLLARCLDSIVAQSYPPAAVIVADDGSACDLSAVRARFADRLPLRWLRHSGGGVCAARNLATLAVREPWTCIMDDDDVMAPGRLLAHARDASRGASDISYGGWINVEEGASAVFHPGKAYSDAALILEGGVLTHGASMIRTDLLRAHAYDEHLPGGGDFDLFARLADARSRFSHCGAYVLFRRLHENRIGGTDARRAVQRDTRRRTVERVRGQWHGREPLTGSEPARRLDIPLPSLSSIAQVCGIAPPFVVELTVGRALAECEALLLLVNREGLQGRFASQRPDSARVSLQIPFASWSDPRLAGLLAEASRGGIRFGIKSEGAGTGIAEVRLRGTDGRTIERRFDRLRDLAYLIDGVADCDDARLVG